MAYNTGNPLGSIDARDLYDNAQNMDKAVNQTTARWTDRFGVSRPSWAGMSHYNNVGEYAAGILITGYNEVFRYDGEFYRAAAATVLPYTTTGSWSEDGPLFVPVGDAVLRHDMAYEADTYIGYYRNAINCNQYGGLEAAVADSGTLGKTIIVTDTQDVSIPLDVTGRDLSVEYGGLITFSGTGAITGLKEACPEWFGAVGDGVTDDYTAIQAAIDSGASVVHLSAKKYLINYALNLTNRAAPIKLKGLGAPYGGNAPGYLGTTIVGNTGTWMVDCTGSNFIDMEDILFLSTAASSNPSKGGILFARSAAGQYVFYSRLIKVYVYIPTFPTFTSVGSIALLGDNTENQVVEHCWFEADTAYVSTLNNNLSVASVYTTISEAINSNTDVSHRQNVYRGITQSAMLLYGQATSTYDQCFWDLAAGNTSNYGIILRSSAGAGYVTSQKLTFTGQLENYPYGFLLDGDTVNIHINMTGVATNTAYIRATSGTNHYGLEINYNLFILTAGKRVLDTSTTSNINLYGGRIVVTGDDKLDSAYVHYIGTDIQMPGNDSHDNAKWNYATGSTYRMLSATSPLFASVALTPGEITTGWSFGGGATCTGARLGDHVQVSSSADLQGCSLTGYVSSSDNCVVVINNNTGLTKTFSSILFRIVVTGLN